MNPARLAFSPGIVLMIWIVFYSSFLGGVEAGYMAESESEYLEARADFRESFSGVRIDVAAKDIGAEFESEEREQSSEEIPTWLEESMDPGTLDRLEAEADKDPEAEAPEEYLRAVGLMMNLAARVGERSALAGLSFGYYYPVSWHIVWIPPILTLYASPWLVIHWHKKQKKAAREAAG